ncbi:6965_t:CDS:2 [Gigaspora margarita]|uniref:6965_t:CDS:1 n=1 Tax=Gigaspora margarita TaxID=4874 RepID=A0ABN7V636_GIGMA|nr:6965_t:CDS:2 [Gigaspora margarita]
MNMSIIGPILVNDQGTVDAPMVGWEFNNWDELDRFITLYAKSQNFVSVICESEYNNKQICASCPETTGILKINSLCLNYNDHPIKDATNKFATKYRTFFEEMLKDIKFWTETDLSNAIQNFKQQNYIEYASSYLNHALFGEKEHWALCHTSKIFTAGMQSTQRVEGQNAIIKNSGNKQSDLNEEFNLTEESNINRILDNFVEDIVDATATLVKELISTTEVELIHEVWETLFQVMKVSNYASFHIILISKRWYVDEKQIEQESQT